MILRSPVCYRKHRNTCFLVKRALFQGWNLWFPGASPGPGGDPGRNEISYLPYGWKWLLTSGGSLSIPQLAPGLQFAGNIKSQKLFWLPFWMCYCPRQHAWGASHSTSQLWAASWTNSHQPQHSYRELRMGIFIRWNFAGSLCSVLFWAQNFARQVNIARALGIPGENRWRHFWMLEIFFFNFINWGKITIKI